MLPPHKKLRIIVGGMVGQFPLGGVAWDYFHYVIGLHQLGHDVYYFEDTGVWPFDPVTHYPSPDGAYTVRFLREFFETYAPELSGKWHYVLDRDARFGMTAEQFGEIAQSADIFLNVSGACFIPKNLGPRCIKAFLDTDPGYNQIMLTEKFAWSRFVDRWCDSVAAHDRHLTYAENIFGADCLVPKLGFDWIPTRCVVTLPEWAAVRQFPPPVDAPLTTVLSWDWFKGPLVFEGVEYSTKAVEFQKFRHLPQRVKMPLALAIGGVKAPYDLIRRDGWQILDAHKITLSPASYQQLIADSAGEWSVAKNVYVAMRTGWFSCRTACYLAAGRPAVVQETGWRRFIPAGDGLMAFETIDQAVAGIDALAADPHKHRAAAYEIAREYLSPDKVLPPMLERICNA